MTRIASRRALVYSRANPSPGPGSTIYIANCDESGTVSHSQRTAAFVAAFSRHWLPGGMSIERSQGMSEQVNDELEKHEAESQLKGLIYAHRFVAAARPPPHVEW